VLQTACSVDFFRLLVLCENNLEANEKKEFVAKAKKIERKKNIAVYNYIFKRNSYYLI